MKIARTIGLAALAALALTASAGVGSAVALETTICKNNTIAPYCKAEDSYPANTTLEAYGELDVTAGGESGISCLNSYLKGATESQSGDPLAVPFDWELAEEEGFSCTSDYAECDGGGSYSGFLSRTAGSSGTFKVNSSVNPSEGGSLVFDCGFYSCTYRIDSALTFNSGSSAELVAKDVPVTLVEEKGLEGFCLNFGVRLNAQFGVDTPAPAFLAVPGPRPAETTALCKAKELYCEPGNLYPKGTLLEGNSTDFTIKTNAGYLVGNLTCAEATITAETTAAYAQPLPLKSTAFSQSECGFEGMGGCPVEGRKSYEGSVSRSAFNGNWNGGGASWRVTCGGQIDCTFSIPSGSTIKIESGNTGTIRIQGVTLNRTGQLCPTSATLSATYPLTAPSGPLYVTDVLR